MAERRERPSSRGVKRAESSPPSPVLLRPCILFIAIAIVSCASLLIEPKLMAPVTKTLHDLAYWFHIFDRNGFSRSEGQEISEEDWCILFVYEMCVFLELLVATQTGCLLEG